MKKLTKGFVLMDDDGDCCPVCGCPQVKTDVPISDVPKKIAMSTYESAYTFWTFKCTTYGQKAIQFYDEKDYD
jgi:hypothetical protein